MTYLALALNAAVYLAGARRTRRRWPAWRTGAFLAGLAVLAVAQSAPMRGGAEETLTTHMAQHLLLVLVVAPLLVLGAPVALALRALRGDARRELARVVTSRPARALVHPLTGWIALAASTASTHLTGFYDAAVGDSAIHALEHVVLLGGGLVWWTSVVGVHPGDRALGPIGALCWLLAAMPVMAGLGAYLAGASHVVYHAYGAGPAVLAEQQRAGSMMWGLGSLPMALAAFALALEGLWREERRQRRREAVGA